MRIIYALTLIFAQSANAQDVGNNVDWNGLSSTPEVNQQVIVQDFIPVDNTKDSNFIQNELTDFEFLNQSIDERVYYKFDAKVRILNKYTDKTNDYNLKPQEVLKLKKFEIKVKSCAIATINNVENQFAFIEILRKGQPAFNGWMSNIHKNMNFPELQEIYLNLISCDKDLTSEEVKVDSVQEISGPSAIIKPIFTN